MPNVRLLMPPKPPRSRQGTREQGYCAEGRPTVEFECKVESEERLWKVCMEAETSLFCTIECIIFLFLGVLGVAATVFSFSELFDFLGK